MDFGYWLLYDRDADFKDMNHLQATLLDSIYIYNNGKHNTNGVFPLNNRWLKDQEIQPNQPSYAKMLVWAINFQKDSPRRNYFFIPMAFFFLYRPVELRP